MHFIRFLRKSCFICLLQCLWTIEFQSQPSGLVSSIRRGFFLSFASVDFEDSRKSTIRDCPRILNRTEQNISKRYKKVPQMTSKVWTQGLYLVFSIVQNLMGRNKKCFDFYLIHHQRNAMKIFIYMLLNILNESLKLTFLR